MPRVTIFPPIDAKGRNLRVGDWVRVVGVPDSIARMSPQTKRVFSVSVGRTFQIEGFDALGCAELDLTGKIGSDTIWIEPFCVVRFRRPKRRSARFRRILAVRRRLDQPRWSLRYTAKYRTGTNVARLLTRLNRNSEFGHGWRVIKGDRKICGVFTTNDRTPRSRRQLEQWRLHLRKCGLFESLRPGQIRLSI
jgi:hypothetical protein